MPRARKLLTLALLAVTVPLAGQPQVALPDVIVADVRLDGNTLVLDVQNQGPGVAPKGAKIIARISARHKNKTVSFDQQLFVPEAVFELTEIRIPLANFKVEDPDEFGPIVTVLLDPEKSLQEERPGNNEFHRQLGQQTNEVRGDFRTSKDLPDLILTNITADNDYLRVEYKNQGKGVTGGDFLIRVRTGKESFDGNYFYRFAVPPPGHTAQTGGITLGLIGLKPGDIATVEATIDYEDRVRETDRTNNSLTKKVTIPKP
jgi:hypothetical protein